jgi:hypothetical protein
MAKAPPPLPNIVAVDIGLPLRPFRFLGFLIFGRRLSSRMPVRLAQLPIIPLKNSHPDHEYDQHREQDISGVGVDVSDMHGRANAASFCSISIGG